MEVGTGVGAGAAGSAMTNGFMVNGILLLVKSEGGEVCMLEVGGGHIGGTWTGGSSRDESNFARQG